VINGIALLQRLYYANIISFCYKSINKPVDHMINGSPCSP